MKSNRTTTYLLISLLLWFLLLLFSHISTASTPTTKHALPTNNNKNNNNVDLLHVSTALNSTTPNNETTNNSNSTSPSNQQQNCSAVPSLYQQPSFSGHAMNLNDTSALNTTTAYQITLVPLSNSGEVDPTIQFLTRTNQKLSYYMTNDPVKFLSMHPEGRFFSAGMLYEFFTFMTVQLNGSLCLSEEMSQPTLTFFPPSLRNMTYFLQKQFPTLKMKETCVVHLNDHFNYFSLTAGNVSVYCCQWDATKSEVTNCRQIANPPKYLAARMIISLVIICWFLTLQVRGLLIYDGWHKPVEFWYETTNDRADDDVLTKLLSEYWIIQVVVRIKLWMDHKIPYRVIFVKMQKLNPWNWPMCTRWRTEKEQEEEKQNLLVEELNLSRESVVERIETVDEGLSSRPLRITQVITQIFLPCIFFSVIVLFNIYVPRGTEGLPDVYVKVRTENFLSLLSYNMEPQSGRQTTISIVIVISYLILNFLQYFYRGSRYIRWCHNYTRVPRVINFVIAGWSLVFLLLPIVIQVPVYLKTSYDPKSDSLNLIYIRYTLLSIASLAVFLVSVQIHVDFNIPERRFWIFRTLLVNLIVNTLYVAATLMVGMVVANMIVGFVWYWVLCIAQSTSRLHLALFFGIVIGMFRSARQSFLQPLVVVRSQLKSTATTCIIKRRDKPIDIKYPWFTWKHEIGKRDRFFTLYNGGILNLVDEEKIAKKKKDEEEKKSKEDAIKKKGYPTPPISDKTPEKTLMLTDHQIRSVMRFADDPVKYGRPIIQDSGGCFHVPMTYIDLLRLKSQCMNDMEHLIQLIMTNAAKLLFTFILVLAFSNVTTLDKTILDSVPLLTAAFIPFFFFGKSNEQLSQEISRRFQSAQRSELDRVRLANSRYKDVKIEKLSWTMLHVDNAPKKLQLLDDSTLWGVSDRFLSEWFAGKAFKSKEEFVTFLQSHLIHKSFTRTPTETQAELVYTVLNSQNLAKFDRRDFLREIECLYQSCSLKEYLTLLFRLFQQFNYKDEQYEVSIQNIDLKKYAQFSAYLIHNSEWGDIISHRYHKILQILKSMKNELKYTPILTYDTWLFYILFKLGEDDKYSTVVKNLKWFDDLASKIARLDQEPKEKVEPKEEDTKLENAEKQDESLDTENEDDTKDDKPDGQMKSVSSFSQFSQISDLHMSILFKEKSELDPEQLVVEVDEFCNVSRLGDWRKVREFQPLVSHIICSTWPNIEATDINLYQQHIHQQHHHPHDHDEYSDTFMHDERTLLDVIDNQIH